MPSITTFPLELLVEILKFVEDPFTLQSVIRSNRCFYNAYNEAKSSIDQEVGLNILCADTIIWCRFLTSGINQFLDPSTCRKAIPEAEIRDWLREYINWANPPKGFSPEDLKIPRVPRAELARTHVYITKWVKQYCKDQLSVHPITGQPTPGHKPPTTTELQRLTKAFYMFWFYFIFYGIIIVCPRRPDNPERDNGSEYMDSPEDEKLDSNGEDISDSGSKISLMIAESFPYQEFMFVLAALMDYVHSSCQELMQRICADAGYLAMCIAKTGNGIGQYGDGTSVDIAERAEATRWFLVSRLGPIDFWDFVHKEESYETKLSIAMRSPPIANFDYIRESYITCKHDVYYPDDVTHCPILRICRDKPQRLELPEGIEWWGWVDDQDEVDKTVVMWDDRRLEEWGYLMPVAVPPLAIEGDKLKLGKWVVDGVEQEEKMLEVHKVSNWTIYRDSFFTDMRG